MDGKIAIITARGGSKRIPKKNIRSFYGKPIIAYSIEAAIKSGCFDEIMVSTDSEEIAAVAEKYGASVPFFRSKETSDDYSTTSEVLLEVIKRYSERGDCFRYGCCVYPTAPFITGEKLREGMKTLIESGADTVIPMVAFSYPPQRGFVVRNGHYVMREPVYIDSRSQDLEKMYHDSGQFYWFCIDSLIKNKELMNGKVDGIVIPDIEAQDIDTVEDWKIAEAKYAILGEKL